MASEWVTKCLYSNTNYNLTLAQQKTGIHGLQLELARKKHNLYFNFKVYDWMRQLWCYSTNDWQVSLINKWLTDKLS